MRRLIPLLLAAVVLALPATASARSLIHFKLLPDSPVVFGSPTAACPVGTKTIAMSSPSGRVIGEQRVCTLRESFPSDDRLVEVDTVELDFGSGNVIKARVTAVFTFSADPSRATFESAGIVTGGSGRYRKARGLLLAYGLVRFADDGAPRLDVDSLVVTTVAG